MANDWDRTDGRGSPGAAEPASLESVASELGGMARAVGTHGFYESLLRAYGRLARHSIITVVRYNRFSKPNFLFHRGFSDDLVQAYLDGFFELDPFYRYWLSHEMPGIVALHELPSGDIKRRKYTSEIQRRSHIRDELAMFLPPVARSSVAVVLERTDGVFRTAEIERIRRVYPVIAGIHDAHVKYTFASLGGEETEIGSSAKVPMTIVDSSGDKVFTNESWRLLEGGDPEVRRSMDEIASSTDAQIEISGHRVLHRTDLGMDFTLAPGGVLYRIETLEERPAIEPPRRVFAQRYPDLSARELDIVELVLQGFSNRAVAEQLSLSHGTIKNYRRRLYEKLGISTERELFLAHIRTAFDT